MPIDPYAALNAMLRAEAARFAPPPRPSRETPAAPPSEPEEGTVPEAPAAAED